MNLEKGIDRTIRRSSTVKINLISALKQAMASEKSLKESFK